MYINIKTITLIPPPQHITFTFNSPGLSPGPDILLLFSPEHKYLDSYWVWEEHLHSLSKIRDLMGGGGLTST